MKTYSTTKNFFNSVTKTALILPALALILFSGCKKNTTAPVNETDMSPVQFVFTSDAHYGLTRATFQGATNVNSHIVNAAMVAKMNSLPDLTLPSDGGLNAGQKIGSVDYILEGGDIANRMETSASVQLASTSWDQFNTDYLQGLTLKNKKGGKADLFLVPGNHDVSNTIGYYATMSPLTDNTSLTNIYNMMVKPATPKTTSTFNYATDRVNYSKEIGGVHFCFVQMWPDSTVRIWLNKDLQTIPTTTPVIIVCHDQPAVVSNHFTNPNGTHSVNNTDKFDNVLDEQFKDGKTATPVAVIEQKALAAFLKQHTNIKAWLHGHTHESKFYTWAGPDNDLNLSTVSADSPMKGLVSSIDETKLTFDFVVLDPKTNTMTVRECYWNPVPATPSTPIKWGNMVTINLK